MGNDVTCAQALGDLIQVRRVVADVHHQRQITVLRLHRYSSDAGRNTNAIRLVVVNRGFRVAMNVGVNPACADVALTAQLDGFQRRAINVTQRRDLAVFERNIAHRIVNEARTAQE